MILVTFIYFLLGVITGLFSGLLGIGGGIIVVPALAYMFYRDHMPDIFVMHIAVGTSLAIMVLTTLRSLWSHLAHPGRDEFLGIAKLLMPTIVVGVILGGVLADVLHPNLLKTIFGIVVFLIAVRLFFSADKIVVTKHLPANSWVRVTGLVMGSASGLLGIGGGTMVIPYLLYYQTSMRIAVRVSIILGFVIAITGSITYYVSGSHTTLPPHCWGYIYWPAWLGISIGSVLFAPVGAELSYHLSSKILKRVFALLMLSISVHMLLFTA